MDEQGLIRRRGDKTAWGLSPQALDMEGLGSSPSFVTHLLCAFGQVTSPLCASVASGQ